MMIPRMIVVVAFLVALGVAYWATPSSANAWSGYGVVYSTAPYYPGYGPPYYHGSGPPYYRGYGPPYYRGFGPPYYPGYGPPYYHGYGPPYSQGFRWPVGKSTMFY